MTLGKCEVCGVSCVGKDGRAYKRCFNHKETKQEQAKVTDQFVPSKPADDSRDKRISRLAVLNTATHIYEVGMKQEQLPDLIKNAQGKTSMVATIISIAEELEKWVYR